MLRFLPCSAVECPRDETWKCVATELQNGEAYLAVEEAGGIFLPFLFVEHLFVRKDKGRAGTDGYGGVLSGEEGIVYTFKGQAVGEASGIANQDDTLAQGVVKGFSSGHPI